MAADEKFQKVQRELNRNVAKNLPRHSQQQEFQWSDLIGTGGHQGNQRDRRVIQS